MMTLFTEPAERAKAMGVFGFVASGGGSIGVLLGGVLTDALDWHWIFLVNVPVGILVVVLAFVLIPSARVATAAQKLDIAGAVTVTASLMLAVYAIVNGNEVGWVTARTLGLLAVSGALLAAFLVIESRVESPLVPLRLFRLRNVAVSNVVGVLWAGAMFACSSSPRSTCSSCSGTRRSRSASRSCGNIIMGILSIGLSARLVMRFGIQCHWPSASVSPRPACCFARARRRELRGRRASGHDPARTRRRNGLQPGVARRDERCRAE